MKKPELIDELARATSLTKQKSAAIVETVFECITAALVKGNKVELRGFGSFRVRQHRSRTGRNPKLGTAVYVSAKKVPRFKTSKRLQKLLNATAHAVSIP
jgi:integration host factor subunit beta